MPDQDDPKPRSRSKSTRKKSHPADIAAEAEAAAAAAAKPRSKSKDKDKPSNPPESAQPVPLAPISQPAPPAEPPRREVENWLAQRLAALDPGDEEDVSDPATQIARDSGLNRSRASQPPLRSPPSSRAPVSSPPRPGARPTPRPAPTVPTPAPASVQLQRRSTPDLTGPGPARVAIPGHGTPLPAPTHGSEMQVMVVAPSVPTPPLPPRASESELSVTEGDPGDEKTPIPQEPWPDFEPLSLPSEEMEPLDDVATPPTAEPEAPRRLPTGSIDEGAWDLLGESDGRGRPAVDDDRTGPGGWATPVPTERASQPAQVQIPPADPVVAIGHTPKPARSSSGVGQPSNPPVVKSTPAPVRPRAANEDAQVDALIAEVERDTRTPRRKPGPFSRWNEDAENSDPGDKRRTSVTPSAVPTLTAPESETQTREADGIGSYDEVFPQGGARGQAPRNRAREEETAALLMDAEPVLTPPAPILPPRLPAFGLAPNLAPPSVSDLATIPAPVAPPPDLPQAGDETPDPASKTEWRPRPAGRDLDEKPLADEKTEIRSFSPKIDTVGDEDAPTAQTLRVEPVTAADLPSASDLLPPRERGGINLWPWMSVGAGMLAFLVPLGIFAAILMVVKWFM